MNLTETEINNEGLLLTAIQGDVLQTWRQQSREHVSSGEDRGSQRILGFKRTGLQLVCYKGAKVQT